MLLLKSHVRSYTRHSASGAAVQVKEHEDSRQAFDKMHSAYHLTANRDKIEKEGFKAGKGSGIGGDTSHIYTSDDPKYLQGLADHLNNVRQIMRKKMHTKAAVEYAGHSKESMAIVRQMMDLYAKHLGRPLTEKEETSVIAFQGPMMRYAEIKPKFGKDLAAFTRGNEYEVVKTRARNEARKSDIMGGERAYQEGNVFLDDYDHYRRHNKLEKSEHAPPGGEDTNGKHYKGGEFTPKAGGVNLYEPTATKKIGKGLEVALKLPALAVDDLFDSNKVTIEEAKKAGRGYYENVLMQKPIASPAFNGESVAFTEMGFDHITGKHQRKLSDSDIVRRLKLLPKVKATITSTPIVDEIRVRSDGAKEYGLLGKFEDGTVIRVVVEEIQEGNKSFLTVYNWEDVSKKIKQESQPAPAPKVGGHGVGLAPSTNPHDDKKIPPQHDARKIKKALPHLHLLRKAAHALDGRIDFNGLPISIETGRSRIRAWKNPHDGTEGMSRMWLPYGYIQGTLGTDGDHLDCFVGPDRTAPNVYIITIMKAPDFTEQDEQKCFLGVESAEEARRVFDASYNEPRFFGEMITMPFEEFKEKALTMKGKMIKSHIQAYQRQTANGGMSQVREYDNRRTPYYNPDAQVAEFGSIPDDVARAAGIPAGPIKLLRGKQFGEHRGFGREHIISQHGESIRQAGYKNEEAFLQDVAENFNAVYEVSNGRIALVADASTGQKIHIIEARYSKGQKYYTVVTGYISDRPKFTERKYKLLWKRVMKALAHIYLLKKRSR